MTRSREAALRAAGLDFEADSGELLGPAGGTRLAPQPASLLLLLVEHAGEVVDRERIKDHLWPGGRVEFDQGIAFAVREIRRALEEVGADPGVVETLPRRGLRFRSGTDEAPGPTRHRNLWMPVALAVAVSALVVFRLAGGPGAEPVVAVFPYAPVDEQPSGLEPLALAITARLTGELNGRAGVVGPTGTAGLDGPTDVEGARSRLGACLLVSGTVRPAGGDTLIVFTQVVRASDRVHVWGRWDTLRADAASDALADAVADPVRQALDGC